MVSLNLLVMASSISKFVTYKLLDPDEKHLTDSLAGVFESKLIRGSVSQCKQTINHNPLTNPLKLTVSMCQFTIESVFPFPEFIEWCVSNSSKSEREIMNSSDSKVLCHVNLQSISEVFSIPEYDDDLIEQFSELSCLELVRGLGQSQLESFISK